MSTHQENIQCNKRFSVIVKKRKKTVSECISSLQALKKVERMVVYAIRR